MKRRFFVTGFLVFYVLIFSQALFGQSLLVPNPKFDEVRSVIQEAVKSGDIPSMSVAVAKDGEIIWEESFGWANREKMIKATPHTMYSMASISKPIMTTGLMTLVEKGSVDLDKPVNDYIAPAKLTAYSGDASNATVRQILNHTSGLAEHYTCFYLDEPDRLPPSKTESIRRYGVLIHPPGEVYQYANFGFSLADHIISKVTRRNFAEFMKNEVFLPLGMTHTSIDVPHGLEEFAAERYDNQGNPVPFYISDHPGASQVFCSAHDLIRFGMFHLKNRLPEQRQILKDETLGLMKTDSDPNPKNNGYGLAFFLKADDYGYPVVWHTGSMRGVNTMLKFVPDKNIAVVVLLNTGSSLRNKVANDIIGVLLPDYGEKWKKERDKPREPTIPFEPVPKLIGEWTGELKTYEEEVPVTMIFQEDGDVHIKIGRQMETLMNRAQFKNDVLTGRCYGTIPSGDARRFPHNISFKIRFIDNLLRGYVSTSFQTERSYGNMSSFIVLNKK